VITTADRIPVDTYGAEPTSVILYVFASWGLALFLLSLFTIVVLIRYRAMVPLICLLLLLEQAGRRLVLAPLHPIIRSEAEAQAISSGAWVNWALTAALALAFVMSLVSRRTKA
jgi:hypothetical protein